MPLKTQCPKCRHEFRLDKPVLLEPGGNRMTAAQKVVQAFGGAVALSAATGIDLSAIYRWSYPKSKRGCGGRVPSRNHSIILKKARANNLDLMPEDLVNV